MSRSNYDKETLKRIIRNEVSQMAESGDLHTEAERDEVEQMATSCFVAHDLRKSEDFDSNAEYLAAEYNVDATEYDDVEELQAAVSAAREEQREQHSQVGYRGGV